MYSGTTCSMWSRKRARLDEANAKFGEAIAKAQSSLTVECKSILDGTIGVSPLAASADLTDGKQSQTELVTAGILLQTSCM